MEFLSFCSVIYVATKKAFCIFFFIFKPTMFIQATLTYHKAPWTSTSTTTITILPPILGLSSVEENLFRGCRNGLLWRRKSLPGIPNSPYGCPIQDSPHNESLALDTQACALAAKWPFYAPSTATAAALSRHHTVVVLPIGPLLAVLQHSMCPPRFLLKRHGLTSSASSASS